MNLRSFINCAAHFLNSNDLMEGNFANHGPFPRHPNILLVKKIANQASN